MRNHTFLAKDTFERRKDVCRTSAMNVRHDLFLYMSIIYVRRMRTLAVLVHNVSGSVARFSLSVVGKTTKKSRALRW